MMMININSVTQYIKCVIKICCWAGKKVISKLSDLVILCIFFFYIFFSFSFPAYIVGTRTKGKAGNVLIRNKQQRKRARESEEVCKREIVYCCGKLRILYSICTCIAQRQTHQKHVRANIMRIMRVIYIFLSLSLCLRETEMLNQR